MNNTWFTIKFAILIVFALGVGAVALPDSIKNMIPEGEIQQTLLSYQTTLGIDLAGGTSLEYNIDFTQAQARADASLLDDNANNDIILDKQAIAAGVVKTLKKRIDPDGTKEVGVFYSQRGEEIHVVVELTSAIDTPENRKKLEKVTSLQFKEPTSAEEEQSIASGYLNAILSGESTFEDLIADVQATNSGNVMPLSSAELEISNFFGDTIAEKIKTISPGETVDTPVATQFGTALVQLANKREKQVEVINEAGGTELETSSVYDFQLLILDTQWKDTGLGGAQFRVAKVTQNQNGMPVTEINFDADGAALFGNITGELAKKTGTICGSNGEQFAIFVDGVNVSDPCVRERIDGGSAIISFGADNYQAAQKEAQELSENLNSGATPAPVTLVSERKISASLGESAFIDSVNAALLGFLLVALWMIFFYRFFGFLAIVALLFYAAVFLFLLKFFGFLVLTLAGVAGIILSIGMAVDANILIFERIREELQAGEKFSDAVKEGFDRAWTSIRDSNTSSLITSFILFALGTSIIKSFAIALAIGIVISMFTAIVFTRYLIVGATPKFLQNNLKALVGEKKAAVK